IIALVHQCILASAHSHLNSSASVHLSVGAPTLSTSKHQYTLASDPELRCPGMQSSGNRVRCPLTSTDILTVRPPFHCFRMDDSLDGSLDGSLDACLDDSLDGSLDSSLDGSLNDSLDGSLGRTIESIRQWDQSAALRESHSNRWTSPPPHSIHH